MPITQGRTVLFVLGLAATGAAILWLPPPSQEEAAGPTTNGTANPPRDGQTGSSGQAGDPTFPHDELGQKADREGIDRVRPEFREELDRALEDLPGAEDVPFRPGIGSPLGLHAGIVAVWAGAWAMAESRAIYRGGETPKDFDGQVWEPLLDAAKAARSAYSKVLMDLEEDREDRTTGIDSETGDRVIDAKELERYESDLRRVRLEHSHYFEELFLALAELAKIAGRPDLVAEVFETFDGAIPMQAAHYTRVGEFDSAEEFMKYDHQVFEQKYGVPVIPPPDPPPPGSKFPVTQAEQKAIRELLDTLWRALEQEDEEKILSLSVDDPDKLRPILRAELAEIKTLSIDATAARFQFLRDEPDGPVTVHADDLLADRVIGGKRQKGETRSTRRIVFVEGTPRFRFLED